ncbi:hypothetical protein [Geodermatophilus poikilotrophus]|uniref:hypothetical protein n=1 Tax=Geodermatophilus poikilotrophus TaxID=1333667 RepID=UPI001587C550|nr:hypothetical protein [Geodermatophilus poikilotrophus]
MRPPAPDQFRAHREETGTRDEVVVEVTIGRVEVRSRPTAPAPGRRPVPAPGVLPLAEYLARRGGR